MAPRHAGQHGESTLPIQCRKVLSGACLVLSCIRTFACTLVRSSVAHKKAGEGSLASILAIFHHLGDLAHNSLHCTRSSSLKAAAAATRLTGNSSSRVSTGSIMPRLEPSSTAFLASASAHLLPITPLCLETQLILIWEQHRWLHFLQSSQSPCIVSSSDCADCALQFVRARTMA